MTERQFQQALLNRRRRSTEPLFSAPPVAAVLRRAARRLRRREAAEAVFERLLPPDVLRRVCVLRTGDHLVDVETKDGMIAERLRRSRAQIERELQRAVAGIRRLRINPATSEAMPEAEND